MRKPSLIDYSNIVNNVVGEIQHQDSQKQTILHSLDKFDAKIAEMLNQNQINQRIYEYKNLIDNSISSSNHKFNNTKPVVAIPKNHTLTDSLLRSTLGCQQKLAKEYLQIYKKVNSSEEQLSNKRINDIKQRFMQSNKFRDFFANAKAFQFSNRSKPKPLIDNEHDEYLKTHLMFLQKPKTLNETTIFHNKKLKDVATKIDQLGGMQDTITNMQSTLNKHELKYQKLNQTFGQPQNIKQQRKSFMNNKLEQNIIFETINKSKELRNALMKKLQ